MARRSSGFGTAVKIIKVVDRDLKRAERERQRRQREAERQARAEIRRAEQQERAAARAAAKALKDEFQTGKEIYEDRALERRIAKEDIINEYMR